MFNVGLTKYRKLQYEMARGWKRVGEGREARMHEVLRLCLQNDSEAYEISGGLREEGMHINGE